MTRFIMTAFGRDRPGITAEVTRLLYINDCNLHETIMSILAEEFTLNLLFSSTNNNILEQLTKECRRLEHETGISAFVRPLSQQPFNPIGPYKTCQLKIEGLDQAGIVYKTSQFLAHRALNIVHLDSKVNAAPESGASIYTMTIQLQIPEHFSLSQLETDLVELADDLHVDVILTKDSLSI
jgi:glycine cleavage system transcriptional repressor